MIYLFINQYFINIRLNIYFLEFRLFHYIIALWIKNKTCIGTILVKLYKLAKNIKTYIKQKWTNLYIWVQYFVFSKPVQSVLLAIINNVRYKRWKTVSIYLFISKFCLRICRGSLFAVCCHHQSILLYHNMKCRFCFYHFINTIILY